MKKCVLLIILIAAVAGCHFGHHNVSGSGNRKTEKRNLGSFSSISTEGTFDVQVVCQKPQDIEIKGDDNILPFITTEVSNNVLHIKSQRGYSVSEPITLRISVPDLEGIYSAGTGTMEVSAVKNENFTINANGSPTIRASGDTKTLKIDAAGTGYIDTHKLHAGRVEVDAKGVANVEVYAREQLDVNISGASHVLYQGDATVNRRVNGPGSVEKKETPGA